MDTISHEEFVKISYELEEYHSIFYHLWDCGKPIFTESVETAAIEFDKNGQYISFLFNPKFWKSLNNYERNFVISHEMLHIILNHGSRMIKDKDGKYDERNNQSMDVVVNHMLIENFGFDKIKLSKFDEFCWMDTVFKGRNDVLPNQNFEYYFEKIDRNVIAKTIDSHDGLKGISQSSKQLFEKIGEGMSDEEKESLKKTIENHFSGSQGNEAGLIEVALNKKKIIKKKKWESVINKWINKKISYEEVEQWIFPNRRLSLIKNELLLPSDSEIENIKKDKINLWFFQDVSGSCYQHADRFFNAARSIPNDNFDIRMFCFDTQVYEISLNDEKIKGFGGTSFTVIEQEIQSIIRKEKTKYPDSVWIMTDGMGDKVVPEIPDRWHFFLTMDNKFVRNLLPAKSKKYMLIDYV